MITRGWEGKKDYVKISLKVPDYQEEMRITAGKNSLIYYPSLMTRKTILLRKISQINFRFS